MKVRNGSKVRFCLSLSILLFFVGCSFFNSDKTVLGGATFGMSKKEVENAIHSNLVPAEALELGCPNAEMAFVSDKDFTAKMKTYKSGLLEAYNALVNFYFMFEDDKLVCASVTFQDKSEVIGRISKQAKEDLLKKYSFLKEEPYRNGVKGNSSTYEDGETMVSLMETLNPDIQGKTTLIVEKSSKKMMKFFSDRRDKINKNPL